MKEQVLKAVLTPRPLAHTIDYEKELNSQQLAAVQAGNGAVLVIAGPGSGKTRVITYRMAYLLEKGISPKSILLLTFTNKAAREMLRRVEAFTGFTSPPDFHGGTFHHVGNLILRRFASLLGYQTNYTILDREDSKDLIEDCVEDLRLTKTRKFPKGGVLVELFSIAQNKETEIAQYIENEYASFEDIKDDIVRVFYTYQTKKKELNVMDFDDLLVNWRKLLMEHEEARAFCQQRFQHILVDEYQDTNRIQGDIVERIAGDNGNLMVVGDDAQSIYSFRGADFTNIIEFPKRYPPAEIFKLEHNYRSTPEILALANDSIRHNRKQFEKNLETSKPAGALPELIACADGDDQAQFVAQKIAELHEGGMALKKMAVLYRAHHLSLELQFELTRLGIPFQVRSGLRFYEQAHVKDAVSYLRILTNPKDELSWKRVLRLYPGIGRTTADKVWNTIQATENPLTTFYGVEVQKSFSKVGKDSHKEFSRLLKLMQAPALKNNPSALIDLVLSESYEEHLKLHFPDAYARIEDLKQLVRYALRFDSLDAFLSELALLTHASYEEVNTSEEETDYVVLSTIHQAKGLEWNVVFLIWLIDGKFPDRRNMDEFEPEALEEERRLFYVAVTRTKETLYLTYPIMAHERSSFEVIQRTSRFITELDKHLYESVILRYE